MFFRRVGRRVLCSAVLALVIISVVQIWVSSGGKVEARRIVNTVVGEGSGKDSIPDGGKGVIDVSQGKKRSKEEVLNKYFGSRRGTRFSGSDTNADNGFRESKRRVPSCPDPLHN